MLNVLLMIVVCHAFLIGSKIGMISCITLTAATYQKVIIIINVMSATPKVDSTSTIHLIFECRYYRSAKGLLVVFQLDALLI